MSVLANSLYNAVKWLLPDASSREWLRALLPRRLVKLRSENGMNFKFVIYPREGGDFGLLMNHEARAREALPQLIKSGDVVFDIGAHRGLYTVLMSYLVGEQGRDMPLSPIRLICSACRRIFS